jgi:hypothetical protein
MKQVLIDVKEACFMSVMMDSSNCLNLNLVPLLVRYHPEKGALVKALELLSLGGETSDILFFYVLEFLKKFELFAIVIAGSADNTNTNSGGLEGRIE